MSDYEQFEPSEKQLLELIAARLKDTNSILLWIKSLLFILLVVLGGYIWKHP